MKANCSRCGKVTEFVQIETMTKAGDHGYCAATGWRCSQCGFVPFVAPEEVKGEK